MECNGVLPTTHFTYRKGLGTCDALLCLSIHCKVHWRVGRRLGSRKLISVQHLILSHHLGILYKLCSVGIGGSVLSILTQFLSNQSQHVMVDGCRSKLINVVSGVPQGSVLGPLLFLLGTLEIFFILENKLIDYADDSTLMAVMPYPGVRVTVAESLIRDLGKISKWCDLWGMKLNASRTKTDSLQVTHNASPVTHINYWRNCTEGVWWRCYIESDIWFQDDLWETSSFGWRIASQRLGILRKSWRVFHDRSLLGRRFWGFVLPVLECCSAVWY